MGPLRLNLQGKVLLLVAGGMTLILILSAYLHAVITRSLVEDDRYNTAVAQTLALAERIVGGGLLRDAEDLRRDIVLVAEGRSDFRQIDVYRNDGTGLNLAATNVPEAPRLPSLDANARDNDLGEMEHPLPDVVTMEIVRNGARHWLISVSISGVGGPGYVDALVIKNPENALVSRLQSQHNAVLGGAIVVCVGLLYLMFARYFRRPARDIVDAMKTARGGQLGARAAVRRADELGEIARGFNLLMEDLGARDREREELMGKISGFNVALRQEVDLATRELRETNEALFQSQQGLARSERLAAMGQIAASLAHEIGTPLNSISGHLQLLARGLPPDSDTRRRVGIIDRQVVFIVGIVGALLRRTHLRRPPLRPTDINGLVGDLLRLVSPMLDARAIRVSVTAHQGLPPVLADRDSLQQVFLNLINNGIDAMPAGGRLDIETRLDTEARVVEVIFRDSGSGFAPEALEHLFDPLWTSKATGSGLGLAIARTIVTEHGGEIDAAQGAGGGAMFRLRLPVAEDAAVA